MKLKIKDLLEWISKIEKSDHFVDFECGSPMAEYMDMETNELFVDERMVVNTDFLAMFVVDAEGERIPEEAMLDDLRDWMDW